MVTKDFKVQYRGSLFWLVFWIIVFFPIAFFLFFTACTFKINQTTYVFQYDGSRFWLCFWILVFFPIAFLLLFLNGMSINIQEDQEMTK